MANLKIENVSLEGINAQENRAIVQFDIAWDEAWENDVNCDGAWVFAKFRAKGGRWSHVTLRAASPNGFNYQDQTPPLFSKGSGGTSSDMGMWVPDALKGVFIFRTRGEGDVRVNQVQLVWDCGKDGVRAQDVGAVELKVFGLEMVYVPEDQHYVGDPRGADGPVNCLYTFPNGGAYLINSEAALSVDAKEGCLYCDQDNDRSRDDVPFVIPEAFPKGYKAFWYMKYEMSSQQYVDFLNTLTRKQQSIHVRSNISTDYIENYYVMTNTNTERFRQTIVCARRDNGTEKPVTFYTYAPARACNGIAWCDVAAYAAWAALRPVTELEFEKACRGPAKPVPSECAWGSTEVGRVDTFDGPDGSGDERKVPTSGLVNACLGSGIAPFKAAQGQTEPDNPGFEGPVSCGLFAKTRHAGIPKRLNDGASYYGIMELSGNVWEPCISLGHPKGRAYKPTHGDGCLDEGGYARVPNWPDESGAGAGVRGGVYRSPDASYLAIALRFAAAHVKAEPRYNGGCRVGF
jgi:formylglycine-generating enzyme required for sulfatase activity